MNHEKFSHLFCVCFIVFSCKDGVDSGIKAENISYTATESSPTEAVSDAKGVAIDLEKPTETQII